VGAKRKDRPIGKGGGEENSGQTAE